MLCKVLEAFSKPDLILRLWPEAKQADLREYHFEVVRLFHNYLAAVSTLRDHTRTLMQQFYSDHQFSGKYQEQVDAKFGTGLGKFVQDLRNFMLHYGLPATNATFLLADGQVQSTIRLDRTKLRDWHGWKAPAKAYIAALLEDPDLLHLVKSYQALVAEFYEWFHGQAAVTSANELAQSTHLRALIEESIHKVR